MFALLIYGTPENLMYVNEAKVQKLLELKT